MCKSNSMDDEIAKLRLDLIRIRENNEEHCRDHWFQLEKLNLRKARAHEQIILITEEKNSTNLVSIHKFAKSLQRSLGRKYSGPTWVVALEARLCRTLHLTRIIGNQIVLAAAACKDMVKDKEANLTKLAKDSSAIEINLLNDVLIVASEVRRIKTKYSSAETQYNARSTFAPLRQNNVILSQSVVLDSRDDIPSREVTETPAPKADKAKSNSCSSTVPFKNSVRTESVKEAEIVII